MAYSTYESSVDSGAPIELYEFTQGAGYWRFTSGDEPFTFSGVTFTPSPVTRDRVKLGQDALKDFLNLEFPRGDAFASQFIGFSPDLITTITLYRFHRNDPDKQLTQYWKGRVVGAKATGNTVSLECESVFTSIQRPGLRARFELSCRHTLYSRGCNASADDFLHAGSVLTISGGTVLTVSGAEQFQDGYFTGGMLVTPGSTSRFIVAHTSNQITLSRPTRDVGVGAALRLYPGCDHLRTTCSGKFNNLDNFGGFPWIPIKNPFSGSSIV